MYRNSCMTETETERERERYFSLSIFLDHSKVLAHSANYSHSTLKCHKNSRREKKNITEMQVQQSNVKF